MQYVSFKFLSGFFELQTPELPIYKGLNEICFLKIIFI